MSALNTRQEQILAAIESHGSVRTIDLAAQFSVTDETIRRDLQVLSDLGQASRVHGGAVSLTGRPKLLSFIERRAINVERKRALARAALDLIQEGQTLAFDSSTTIFELVCRLPDRSQRVITNAHPMIHQLIDAQHIQLISTGGRYDARTQTFVGQETIDVIARHNIHQAFVSCIGFDPERGASEGFEQQSVFKQRLIEIAESVTLILDSTKFDKRSDYFFARPNQINTVVTDGDLDPSIRRRVEARGIQVVLAEST